MSASDDEEIPGREVAYRVFAAEYDDASLSYAESDEERAPNYVVTPTGARINRLFAVGTLTEVTSVNEEMVRARVVDPTGAFVVYAGQYQPDELAALESIDPPAFVAVSGKARTFEPDDGDRVYTSIRPESVATVDADTRDRWVVSTAERTIDRIGAAAAAADLEADDEAVTDALTEVGVDAGLAAGIPIARDHYGTTPSYLAAIRDCTREAVAVVAGDRDQVSGLDLTPDESGDDAATFASLADLGDVSLEGVALETDDAATEPDDPIAATPDDSEPVASGSAAGTAGGDNETTVAETDAPSTTESDEDAGSEPAVAETDIDAGADPTSGLAADDEDVESELVADDVAGTADDDVTTDDAGTADGESSPEGTVDVDADGMYEMDDEEREKLEDEFGAEFTTGSEVDDPGSADIDLEESDGPTDESADAPGESSLEADADATATDDDLGAAPTSGLEADDEDDEDGESEPVEGADPTADDAGTAEGDDTEPGEDDAESAADAEGAADESGDASDVDLESYVVERMEDLDDGDGADREELVAAVVDDTGATPADVETAIDDALMGGQCYEPDDETLKAI